MSYCLSLCESSYQFGDIIQMINWSFQDIFQSFYCIRIIPHKHFFPLKLSEMHMFSRIWSGASLITFKPNYLYQTCLIDTLFTYSNRHFMFIISRGTCIIAYEICCPAVTSGHQVCGVSAYLCLVSKLCCVRNGRNTYTYSIWSKWRPNGICLILTFKSSTKKYAFDFNTC